MPELLPTGHFPVDPVALDRDDLNQTYCDLRNSYKSVMISRGVFRSKADQNRAAMRELENKLRAIAEREASVRQEAYEMLEIVTNVVGELEDAGDSLVNEFGAYQLGRRSYQGGAFIGRLIKAVIRFINRWTSTKKQLTAMVDKQQAMQATLTEGADGTDR